MQGSNSQTNSKQSVVTGPHILMVMKTNIEVIFLYKESSN